MYPMIMADSLLEYSHKDEKYYEDVNPFMYAALKTTGGLFSKSPASVAGWKSLLSREVWKRGQRSAIPLVKDAALTGDMPGKDSSAIFTGYPGTGCQSSSIPGL